MGRIFRHGDAEQPREILHLAEKESHPVFQPAQRLVRPAGADGPGRAVQQFHPGPLREFVIERARHEARLVEIEIYPKSVSLAACHDFLQVLQADFPAAGVFLGSGDGIEMAQQRMHPDAADSHGCVLPEQILRHRIRDLCVQKDIPAAGGEGVDIIEFKTIRVGLAEGLSLPKTLREGEWSIQVAGIPDGEAFLHEAPYFRSPTPLHFGKLPIAHVSRGGLVVPHL